MFKQLQEKNGFSIVEVIVAAIIFAMVAGGIYSAITGLTRPAEQSSREVTAALLAKQILEDIRSNLNAEVWGGGLYVNQITTFNNQTIDGVQYQPVYSAIIDPVTNGMIVNLEIRYP